MSTIKITSEVASSLSTAIIPLISGGTPESILFSAGMQPLVQKAFESILSDIFSKSIPKGNVQGWELHIELQSQRSTKI